MVRNIGKVYSGGVLSKAFAIGSLLLLVRGLSIGEFAAYTVFHSIRNLVPGLVYGGINVALVRFSTEYLSREKRKPVELYFMAFVSGTFLFALFSIFLLSMSGTVCSILFGGAEYKDSFRYGLLAGAFLGLYLITWQGGMIFVVIIAVYLIIQYIINHLRGISSDPIAFSSFFLFLIALIIFLPVSNFRDLNTAMIGVTFMPIVLSGISYLMSASKLNRFYYPVSVIALEKSIRLPAPSATRSVMSVGGLARLVTDGARTWPPAFTLRSPSCRSSGPLSVTSPPSTSRVAMSCIENVP